jgi:type I restriction enzyme S subunit
MFNLNSGALHLERLERIQASVEEQWAYAVLPGDILVSRVNSRDLVGKSAVVNSIGEAAVFEAMLMRLRVKHDVHPSLLVQLMNAPQFLHELRGRAKHAIGQSSINQDDLLTMTVPNMPADVQQRLASDVGNQIAVAQQLTRAMADVPPAPLLRSAIIRKAFSGEL